MDNDIFVAQEVRRRAQTHLLQDDPAELFARTDAPISGDHDLNPDLRSKLTNPLKAAAVLVPIVDRSHAPQILLTQRSDTLPTHAGQISFPGGKVDRTDKDPLDTALREAEEEVGLRRQLVDVLGYLDPYETGTGYRILPVVALISPDFQPVPEPDEVADVFEVPLAFLMSSENHERYARTFDGIERRFHAMSYDGRFIWGATAGILKNLYDKIYRT